MKTKLILLLLIISLNSCETEEMKPFHITIVSSKKLADNPESSMPTLILSILKPIECNNKAYIPEISVIRNDLDADSSYKIEIPKESANEIRDWIGTYDYSNFKDDYATYLEKAKAGNYLSIESNSKKASVNNNSNQSDLTFVLTDQILNGDSNYFDNIDTIANRINEMICNGKFDIGNKIIIVIDNDRNNNSISDTISANSALYNFMIWSEKGRRSITETDSVLQSLELKYPNDYRFTLERLKLKSVQGVLKKSDEYLLLAAVQKAINAGKTKELLNIIEKLNVAGETKITAKRKIEKKDQDVSSKKVTADIRLSYRKQKIDIKLSILADESYSTAERSIFKNIALEDFETPTTKVILTTPDGIGLLETKNIDDYLQKVQFTRDYELKVLSIEYGPTGKISLLRVTEKNL